MASTWFVVAGLSTPAQRTAPASGKPKPSSAKGSATMKKQRAPRPAALSALGAICRMMTVLLLLVPGVVLPLPRAESFAPASTSPLPLRRRGSAQGRGGAAPCGGFAFGSVGRNPVASRSSAQRSRSRRSLSASASSASSAASAITPNRSSGGALLRWLCSKASNAARISLGLAPRRRHGAKPTAIPKTAAATPIRAALRRWAAALLLSAALWHHPITANANAPLPHAPVAAAVPSVRGPRPASELPSDNPRGAATATASKGPATAAFLASAAATAAAVDVSRRHRAAASREVEAEEKRRRFRSNLRRTAAGIAPPSPPASSSDSPPTTSGTPRQSSAATKQKTDRELVQEVLDRVQRSQGNVPALRRTKTSSPPPDEDQGDDQGTDVPRLSALSAAVSSAASRGAETPMKERPPPVSAPDEAEGFGGTAIVRRTASVAGSEAPTVVQSLQSVSGKSVEDDGPTMWEPEEAVLGAATADADASTAHEAPADPAKPLLRHVGVTEEVDGVATSGEAEVATAAAVNLPAPDGSGPPREADGLSAVEEFVASDGGPLSSPVVADAPPAATLEVDLVGAAATTSGLSIAPEAPAALHAAPSASASDLSELAPAPESREEMQVAFLEAGSAPRSALPSPTEEPRPATAADTTLPATEPVGTEKSTESAADAPLAVEAKTMPEDESVLMRTSHKATSKRYLSSPYLEYLEHPSLQEEGPLTLDAGTTQEVAAPETANSDAHIRALAVVPGESNVDVQLEHAPASVTATAEPEPVIAVLEPDPTAPTPSQTSTFQVHHAIEQAEVERKVKIDAPEEECLSGSSTLLPVESAKEDILPQESMVPQSDDSPVDSFPAWIREKVRSKRQQQQQQQQEEQQLQEQSGKSAVATATLTKPMTVRLSRAATIVTPVTQKTRAKLEASLLLPKILAASQAEKHKRARQQPKSPAEEDALARKYAAIPTLEERAYAILKDLGMLEVAEGSGST